MNWLAPRFECIYNRISEALEHKNVRKTINILYNGEEKHIRCIIKLIMIQSQNGII